MRLETFFESRKIRLQLEQSEDDAQELKTKLASAEVNCVLKRAVLWAASGLASKSELFLQKGREVLDEIDVLERSASRTHCSERF